MQVAASRVGSTASSPVLHPVRSLPHHLLRGQEHPVEDAEADEPGEVAPTQPIKGEVGGHHDDQIGAHPNTGGAGGPQRCAGSRSGQAWACS